MQAFDSQLWKQRAWDRFGAALRAGKSKKRAESDWVLEVIAIVGIEALVGWCSSKKLNVRFSRHVGATYYPVAKTIVVSKRMTPRRQLMFLIHECGHHLIGMKEHSERYGMGYPQTSAKMKRTFHHRVSCLEEEMEAWHRGWKLAVRLNIDVDRGEFDRVRLECLRSYIKWSLDPVARGD